MSGTLSLEQRYLAVMSRIERAALAAGRDPADVRLLAVSKTFAAGSILQLAAAGQLAFGENYLQEALGKVAALSHLRPEKARLAGMAMPGSEPKGEPSGEPGLPGPAEMAQLLAVVEGSSRRALEWHFIGPIQSNKTRKIAESFDWVQSVDEIRIAQRLADQRPFHLPPLNICLQVNVSGEASKSGCRPEEVVGLAREVARLPNLRLRGLMAIPEATDDATLQASRFSQVRELFDAVRDSASAAVEREGRHSDPLSFDTLSMGMSADLESAIANGATLVRVGSALFGERPQPR
jgi:pyridoxal phosphate enzyme (YggS family)